MYECMYVILADFCNTQSPYKKLPGAYGWKNKGVMGFWGSIFFWNGNFWNVFFWKIIFFRWTLTEFKLNFVMLEEIIH